MGNNMRLSVHGALPCYHGFIAKHSCLHVCMHVRVRRLAWVTCMRFVPQSNLAKVYRFACKHAKLLIVAPHAPTVVRTAERCVHAHVRTAERCAPTIVRTAKRCIRAHAHTAERCAHVHTCTAKRCREDTTIVSHVAPCIALQCILSTLQNRIIMQ